MAKPKPLISTESSQPRDMSFAHFGPLPPPVKSPTATFISVTVNVLLALIIVIVGAAGVKKVKDDRIKEALYVVPIKEKPPEPPKPKIIPPKPPPPLPKVPPPEPKIKLPDVKIPDPPKPIPVPVVPKPVPIVTPAPPKMVVAAAAPKVVSVKMPSQSAALPNNSPHPTPIALGSMTNPIAKSNLPATAAVNLGNAGAANMPASNSGRGPVSKVALGGNGSPSGSTNGTGVRAIQGVAIGGVTGGTGNKPGNGIGTRPATVALGVQPAPPPATTAVIKTAMSKPPSVLYRPDPVYTAEATAMKLQGAVMVKVHVSASGAVTVLGVTSGLGHGLDQSALRAAGQMKFKPATDANGNPIDWEGSVKITFQMA